VGICKEYKVTGLAVCYEFYPRIGRGSRICVPFVPIRAIVLYRSQLKPPRLRSSASGGLPGFLFFDDADCDGCQRRTSRVSFLRCCRLRWVPGQRRCAQRLLSHPSLSFLTSRPFPAQHHAAGRHLDNGLLAASLWPGSPAPWRWRRCSCPTRTASRSASSGKCSKPPTPSIPSGAMRPRYRVVPSSPLICLSRFYR